MKKELNEKVVAVREQLLEDLDVIVFLLKTSAATEPNIRALLRGDGEKFPK